MVVRVRKKTVIEPLKDSPLWASNVTCVDIPNQFYIETLDIKKRNLKEFTKVIRAWEYWKMDYVPLQLIMWMLDYYKSSEENARVNKLEAIKFYLHKKCSTFLSEEFRVIFDIIDFKFRKDVTLTPKKLIDKIIENGYGNIVVFLSHILNIKILGDKPRKWTTENIVHAISNDQFKLVPTLHRHRDDPTVLLETESSKEFVREYKKNNEIVQKTEEELEEEYFQQYSACAAAALKGNLKTLMFLHDNGYRWNHLTTLYACAGNSGQCLEYALENGCEFSNDCNELCKRRKYNKLSLILAKQNRYVPTDSENDGYVSL